MQPLKQAPLWDEGISSFLYGQFEKNQSPLTIEQLQHYAVEHAVRIGDILETLFLMALYGEWKYINAAGEEQNLDEDALNELYAKGRLSREDLQAFAGLWLPANSPSSVRGTSTDVPTT